MKSMNIPLTASLALLLSASLAFAEEDPASAPSADEIAVDAAEEIALDAADPDVGEAAEEAVEAATEPASEEPAATVEVAVTEELAPEAIPEPATEPAPEAEESAPKAEETEEPAKPEIPAEPEEPRVSMAFEQATLPDVVAAFRMQTGANIVSGWTNEFTQLVSIRLDDKPWQQALIAILRPFHLELREIPRGSGIWMVSEPQPGEAVKRLTQTFKLNHVEAKDVREIFLGIMGKETPIFADKSSNVVIVKGTEEQLDQCKQIVSAIDHPAKQVYIEARFVKLSAGASKKLGLKWDSLDEFGVTLSKLGGGFNLSDAKLSAFRQNTSMHTDNRTSTKVDGSRSNSRSIENVESWTTLSPSALTDSTLGGYTADELSYRHSYAFGGQLSVTELGLMLSAFEQMDGAQVFSNPKVIVRNGKTAEVDMTEKYPYVEVDYQRASDSSSSDSISSKLESIPGDKARNPWSGDAFFSYGITLSVTPSVSSDGYVTVEITPAISERVGTKPVYLDANKSIANEYPIISLRKLDTKFTMEDGKTAVIGGLTETSEKTIDSGIPLLRKIPWIGPRLFGWKSRIKTQDEILVFVTVNIADPATEVSDGMPKNAVLGNLLMNGEIKEPGDRTSEEMWDLDRKPIGYYK